MVQYNRSHYVKYAFIMVVGESRIAPPAPPSKRPEVAMRIDPIVPRYPAVAEDAERAPVGFCS